ncbi:AhpC/TSA family protein [Maribacter algarum]|uniref:AhpC/TSA family protein n=1 Tax=Maribacter algarum (ex Zhang et al. 2020) TaxID=2578118 RepID=A0A5S3PW59_9FLAO|nr:TlpA disulfide reductase family protein [Maribacter algarum]TMM57228.1 AhpC/TSA family protein [Maribacter algarum]
MKKIILSFSILIALVACNQNPDGYTIEGTLAGELENGTKVFLKKQGENRQPVDVDTTEIQDGKFVFTGQAGIPEVNYIFIDKIQGYRAVVIENGEIEITGQKDSLGLAKVKGTLQNDFFTAYMKKARSMSKQAMAIQKDMQAASGNETALASLRDEMNDFQEEAKTFESDFIKANPNALISVLLLDNAIASRTIEAEEVQGIFDSFTPEMKETAAAKRIAEQLDAINKKAEKAKSTKVGVKAPEFTAPGVNGEQLALKDMLGKVTLVDFWAAWCKPCRRENPNVVAVYKKYHDKGLNIVGVSLDRRAEDWKKAIADDGLNWNHVSHVQYFNDPIAQLYNVDAIPAAFLLDENGIIVAKNLRGSALEDKVAELLN